MLWVTYELHARRVSERLLRYVYLYPHSPIPLATILSYWHLNMYISVIQPVTEFIVTYVNYKWVSTLSAAEINVGDNNSELTLIFGATNYFLLHYFLELKLNITKNQKTSTIISRPSKFSPLFLTIFSIFSLSCFFQIWEHVRAQKRDAELVDVPGQDDAVDDDKMVRWMIMRI